jgi:hypothetical protein
MAANSSALRAGPRGIGRSATGWLALGAIAGPALFTLAWAVLGFLSPGYTLYGTHIAPYSPVTQPVSGLGLGPTGPFMNAAFVVGGLLTLMGAVAAVQGIRELGAGARRTCATLLAMPGLGMIVSGVFTLESFKLHFLGVLIAIGTPVVGFVVAGLLLRRAPAWRRLGGWMIAGGPLTLALAVVFFVSFDPVGAGAGRGVAGLTERVLILELVAWIVAVGWLGFRTREGASPDA